MTLHAHLQSLASQFVSEILSALQTATLSELQGTGIRLAPPTLPRVHGDRPAPSPATTSTGRLKRRTLEEVQAVVGQLVTLLGKHPAGLRAEQIRTLMSLDVREVPRILKEAVGGKGVKILSGRKRSTLYGLRSAAGKPAVAKKKSAKRATSKSPAKKTAKRTTKRPAKQSAPKRTKAGVKGGKGTKSKKSASKKSAPKKAPKRSPKRLAKVAKVAAPPPPTSAMIPAAAE